MARLNSSTIIPLDGKWLIATDPQNIGREERWWEDPGTSAAAANLQTNAKETKVPWIIQDAFPGYAGVAWYWRTFDAPVNQHKNGRYLLRFWAVDYMANVWLNGNHVGGHEGAEGVFVLDVTSAIRPEAENVLAVRVLNPTNEAIDGIVLGETCHYLKVDPFNPGACVDRTGRSRGSSGRSNQYVLRLFSGLFTAVHEFGAGRFIINTLLIRENLGPNPVAERLLR